MDISNDNHKMSFKNIKKPFFVMRIQVFVDDNVNPEPHFMTFMLKGDYYYLLIWRGERYKIIQTAQEK